MSAPVATLPLVDNDARPSRPVIFQTPQGAITHAARSARHASSSGTCRELTGVKNCFEPVEPTDGAVAYRAELGLLNEWHVFTVTGAEYARLAQAGLRSAIAACEHTAKAHEIAASTMRPGALHAQHLRFAAEARDRGRDLETQLTVSMARRAASDEDAFEARNRALPPHLQRD